MKLHIKLTGMLSIAAAITFLVFATIGGVIKAKPPNSLPQPRSEITFAVENVNTIESTKAIQRPPTPETKRKTFYNKKAIIDEGWIHIPRDPKREKELLLRLLPKMPKNATKSGSCTFRVKVNSQGRPVSLKELKCTDGIFIKPTEVAVKKWVFNPVVENGTLVPFLSARQKVSYHFTDENGYTIPE